MRFPQVDDGDDASRTDDVEVGCIEVVGLSRAEQASFSQGA